MSTLQIPYGFLSNSTPASTQQRWCLQFIRLKSPTSGCHRAEERASQMVIYSIVLLWEKSIYLKFKNTLVSLLSPFPASIQSCMTSVIWECMPPHMWGPSYMSVLSSTLFEAVSLAAVYDRLAGPWAAEESPASASQLATDVLEL